MTTELLSVALQTVDGSTTTLAELGDDSPLVVVWLRHYG